MSFNVSKIAVAVAAVGLLAGSAQAATLWHFPYKSAPYARVHKASPRPVHKSPLAKPHLKARVGQVRAASDGGKVNVAHHKPPYHGGPPRAELPEPENWKSA